MKRNKVAWPTIVDSARLFEKLSLDSEISLKKIWTYRTINANGEFTIAKGSDVDKVIENLLKDASWNIDPKAMPPSMLKTWKAVEFGDFQAAAQGVRKAMRSSSEEIKSAGDQLNEYVQNLINPQLAIASEAKENGDLWLAYKTYSQVEDVFGAYDMETDPRPIIKTLKKDSAVIDELAALKLLDAVRRRTVTTDSAYKAAVLRLKKIIDKYPDTEAAKTSAELLESEQ